MEVTLPAHPVSTAQTAFATTLEQSIQVSRDKLTQNILATLDVFSGSAREFPLKIQGQGEIRQVTGEMLQDWSVRQETNGTRTLVLRTRQTDTTLKQFVVDIAVHLQLEDWAVPCTPVLSPAEPH